MARLESTAIAGYVPTPSHLIHAIASRVSLKNEYVQVMDPCAGDGAAAASLIEAMYGAGWQKSKSPKVHLYAIEMERSRYAALNASLADRFSYPHDRSFLHGDAFKAQWRLQSSSSGVGLLYLNPPYDNDAYDKKLEARFLRRFSQVVAPGGVLVFVVPVSALASCAELLALNYSDLTCFRFPDADYALYKQVVIYGKKTELMRPSESALNQVREWSNSPLSLPELTVGKPVVTSKIGGGGISGFLMGSLDVLRACQQMAQWTSTTKKGLVEPIPGILPVEKDIFAKKYPLAMPPRSAHIANGIAAGVFNGHEISPSDPDLPPLLIKGVFEKSWVNADDEDDGAQVQQQRPRLVTTALDLSTYAYTTFKASADITGTKSIPDMTMGDLLHNYGKSLMDVMLKQCPVLHDPSNPSHMIPLKKINRILFPAQEQATMAVVKLLGGLSCRRRKHKAAFILGEVGTGKTTVALSTAQTISAKCPLVICPSHIVTEWRDQIEEILPEAVPVMIETIEDLHRLRDLKGQMRIGILSKETAKLGHAHVSVRGTCPSCGEPVDPSVNAAKRRARCPWTSMRPDNRAAELMVRYGRAIFPHFPDCELSYQTFSTKALTSWADRIKKKFTDGTYKKPSPHALLDDPIHEDIYRMLVEQVRARSYASVQALHVLLLLRQDLFDRWVDDLSCLSVELEDVHGDDYSAWWTACRDSVHVTNFIFNDKRKDAYRKALEAYPAFRAHIDAHDFYKHKSQWKDHDVKFTLAKRLLVELKKLAVFSRTEPCGEFLYQAIPKPRRVSLAKYISTYMKDVFDLLILDEGHEYATDGSAQEKAAHRLTAMGIPTLLMTGTIMNGYASSLFTNLWALSPEFRKEFGRDEIQRYMSVYGLLKRILRLEDKASDYGEVTDRTEKSQIVGAAPGVLPLLLIKYLLPLAVTLHKADLSIEIPPSCEEVIPIAPSDKQKKIHEQGLNELLLRIEADREDKERKGKLFGALADYPGQLDLASEDTGNQDDNTYEIRYPESLDRELVLRLESLPRDELLPKEAWLIDTVKKEVALGRRLLVYVWHTVLGPRLVRLLREHAGVRVEILNAGKVPPKKRKKWINDQVIAKDVSVLVCNPTTIQTGLNNLVYFATSVYMQNPACKPIVKRQTDGRIDRIGQLLTTRVLFPVYSDTSQVHLHALLMHKVAVSRATDGLDAEEALKAAGIIDDRDFTAFSVGRQLYEMLKENKPMGDKYRIPLSAIAPPETKPLVSDNDILSLMAQWSS